MYVALIQFMCLTGVTQLTSCKTHNASTSYYFVYDICGVENLLFREYHSDRH